MNKILPQLGLICVITGLLYFGGNTLNFKKPRLNLNAQLTQINIQKEFIQIFNLGVKRVISSLSWINTMMDGDLEHYDNNDLNSWMFKRFDLITDLDPHFIEAYWYGGQYLGVIKDDEIGAEKLFLKGYELYPNDYFINYYLGSHYLIELKDNKKALQHYKKIFYHPNTGEHIKSLTTKLLRSEGYEEESLKLLRELYERAPENSYLKKRYKEMLISSQ